VQPKPDEAAASSAPASGAPASSDEHGAVALTFKFAPGSATPLPETIALLDQFGKALAHSDIAGAKFRIEGHTDTTGDRTINKALSERRAQVVAQYLESKFGFAADRLEAVGLGQENLLVPTADNVPEPRNRVVRIVNLGS
jgi:outer membrane protein OmpA-like peptidoglycan-associated protein